MELVIEHQEEKPLVERTEITAKASSFKATPSNAQLREALAKLLNKPAELIVVKHIHQRFGRPEAKISAYLYRSIEALKKFEPKPKGKKEEKAET